MAAFNLTLFRFMGWNTQGDLGPWTFYTTRRNELVYFPKAPPLSPPSPDQIHQRNKFKLIAKTWNALKRSTRQTWEAASKSASLRIHGYDLFTYYQLSRDRAAIRTIEHQTNLKLLDPENL